MSTGKTIGAIALIALRALLVALSFTVAYSVLLALNRRLAPGVPWFPVVTLLLWWPVAHWGLKPVRGERRPPAVPARPALVWAFGATAIAACFGIGLLQGAWSGMVAIPPAAPGASGALALAVALAAYPLAGVVEEVTFRGVLQLMLSRWVGVVAAIAVSSILFVASHVSNANFFAQWIAYCVFSIAMGLVAWATGSVRHCIVLHVTLNIVVSLLVYRTAPAPLANLSVAFLGAVAALTCVLLGVSTFLAWRILAAARTTR